MEEMHITIDPNSLETVVENPTIEDIPSSIAKQEPTAMGIKKEKTKPEVITTINSANYGGFIKILSLLSRNMGKMDVLNIEDGKVNTVSGNGHIFCDLSMLFGKNDFGIIDPQYNIKLLKLISGGDEVEFIDDPDTGHSIISNIVDGKTQSYVLIKKPDDLNHTKITKPDMGTLQEVVEELDPDLVNTIMTSEKSLDSQYFILDIIDDNGVSRVSSISTDKEDFKFNFIDDIDEDKVTQYKIFSPFPIDKPEDITFEVYKDKNDGLWVKTISIIGMANVEYTEKLNEVGQFHTFGL